MFKPQSPQRGQGFLSQVFCSGLLGDQPSGSWFPYHLLRRPVFVRLTRGLGGRLETQVLNKRPVSSRLTKSLPVPALGEAVRRLEVVTSRHGSLHPTIRVHWAAGSWLHTEVSTEPGRFPRSEDTSSRVRVASGSLLNLGGARPSLGSSHCLLSKCWTLGIFAGPVEHRVPVQLPTAQSRSKRLQQLSKGVLLDSEKLGQWGFRE